MSFKSHKPRWSLPEFSSTQGDILIASLFVLGIVLFTAGWRSERAWGTALSVAMAVCIVLLFYASFLEPRRVVVTRTKVTGLPEGLRIAVLSDLHVGPFKGLGWVQKVVQKINSLKPDLILLPGDFLYDEKESLDPLDALKDLRAPLGMFAVAGNHDAGHFIDHNNHWRFEIDRTADLDAFLTPRGITMMRNTSSILTHQGKTFALAGVDDLWGESCDLEKALKGIPDSVPVILITHHPDTILDERSKRAQLMVCGHTHGGQVRLPFIGALAGTPSIVGKTYDQGLFTLESGRQLFVSRGAGETLLRVRFWCRPEIALLECA